MSTQTETRPETATTPQHGSIVHIELAVPDLTQAQPFYAQLFGWEFHPFTDTTSYFMTPRQWGPCGCLNKGTPATSDASTFYVNVDDIPATLAKAEKLGGRTALPRTEIPGGHGFFALIKAPDGNVVGIHSRS